MITADNFTLTDDQRIVLRMGQPVPKGSRPASRIREFKTVIRRMHMTDLIVVQALLISGGRERILTTDRIIANEILSRMIER